MKILLGTLLAFFSVNVNAHNILEAEIPVYSSLVSDKENYTNSDIGIYKSVNGQTLLRVNPNSRVNEAIKKMQKETNDRYNDLMQKFEEERQKKRNYEIQLAKKPNAKIGMTKDKIVNKSNWGEPDDINTTIDSYGTFEQWVYGSSQYLYFKNGKLTSIQQ